MSVRSRDLREDAGRRSRRADGLVWACWCQAVSFSVSLGRSRAAGRSPRVPRGRGRRSPGACRPISILRDCPASCRARRGIRPAERSAPQPRLPNVWVVGGRRGAGAAHGPPVCSRSLARRRACRSAAVSGASWMRCLGILISVVKRDCHVSRVARASVGLSFDDKRCWHQTVRGEFARKARTSRHKLVSGGLCCELNHDAVIRIGRSSRAAGPF